jgi:hypothetical protein
MILKKIVNFIFRLFLIMTVICFIGLMYVFIHSYYLCSYKTVRNVHDPHWRIFDYNSRQASEDEIYNVAEVPSLKSARLVDHRKLRFEFILPVKTNSWKIISMNDNRIVSSGKYPEIRFPDDIQTETYSFIPEGVHLNKEITIEITFYPKEEYRKENLSWPDDYWIEAISIPIGLTTPYSVDEWAGIPDTDPEIIEARSILGNRVTNDAPTMEKIEQVYRFAMENMNYAHETPSDEVQSASPLEIYRMLNTGKGKGWCENHALVYYLFANAAGIKTRLIHRAGKIGHLQVKNSHYFCESWIPEYATWAYVDPETYTAYVKNSKGIPITTLTLKRLIDLDVFEGYEARVYDFTGHAYTTIHDGEIREHYKNNFLCTIFKGDIVIGYQFGYGNNKSFSKIRNFLNYTTLLYSPFTLPKLYLVKVSFLWGFIVCAGVMIVAGFFMILMKIKSN